MTTRIELPLPHYVGEPRTVRAKCCECEAVATASVEFIAMFVNEAGSPLGVWAPPVYECPAGHFTLDSEADEVDESTLSFAEADALGLVDWSAEEAAEDA
jgi:hypothetical protein